MRCPSCAKFTSYGEPEVEVDSFEDTVDDGAHLTAEVIVKLNCADCGEELKETALSASEPLPDHTCDLGDVIKALIGRGNTDPGTDDVDKEVADRTFDVTECEAEGFERSQDTDAKGKKITNPRYARTFYGASITWEYTCTACMLEFTATTDVEEQASAFSEVV